jgi:vacuolar iron transporter family protein
MTADPVKRYRKIWQDEIDSATQYRAMADGKADPAVARVYRELAAMEDKHAAFWEGELQKRGATPGRRRASWRARVLAWIARRVARGRRRPPVTSNGFARPRRHETVRALFRARSAVTGG